MTLKENARVARLIALTAFGDLLPAAFGPVTCTDATPEALFAITPFAGKADQVSAALQDQIGLPLAAPGQARAEGGQFCVWSAQGQWLISAPAHLAGLAAVVDLSDYYAGITLTGAGHDDLLARLVPVDLRLAHFPTGRVIRSLLGQMPALIIRPADDAISVMVPRSMAQSLVQDLTRTATIWQARQVAV
jgi:heterotetrameric sarcosine oxidase gamma subunit